MERITKRRIKKMSLFTSAHFANYGDDGHGDSALSHSLFRVYRMEVYSDHGRLISGS